MTRFLRTVSCRQVYGNVMFFFTVAVVVYRFLCRTAYCKHNVNFKFRREVCLSIRFMISTTQAFVLIFAVLE